MAKLNDTLAPNRVLSHSVEFGNEGKEWPNGRQTVKRRWTTSLNAWEIEYDGITGAEYASLKAFFVARSGTFESFTFDDPHTLTTYTVRFVDQALMRQNITPNVRAYRVRVKLREVKS